MIQQASTRTLMRFWLGAVGGIGAGYLAFRQEIFRPDRPEFECVTLGTLSAGVLALVRSRRHPEALALVAAYALLMTAIAPGERWLSGLAGLGLAGGIYLSARVFDELADYGFRLGKFLLLGPLLGGVFLALAPLAGPERFGELESVVPLLRELFLGVVIGDGVGAGVEIAELLWPAREPAALPSRHEAF